MGKDRCEVNTKIDKAVLFGTNKKKDELALFVSM